MTEIKELRYTVVEDRMVRSIYTVLQGGADTEKISKDLNVSRYTARRYMGILRKARMVSCKNARSSNGRACMRIAMYPSICFAILRIDKDLVKITVCSFSPQYIHVVSVPYNEALMPEDNVDNIAYLLKRICADALAERVFVGVITCADACIDEKLCSGFGAECVLSCITCERLAENREKERACVFTECFCDSVRKARMSERVADSWRSMESAERGMIDALLINIAKKIHGSLMGKR